MDNCLFFYVSFVIITNSYCKSSIEEYIPLSSDFWMWLIIVFSIFNKTRVYTFYGTTGTENERSALIYLYLILMLLPFSAVPLG